MRCAPALIVGFALGILAGLLVVARSGAVPAQLVEKAVSLCAEHGGIMALDRWHVVCSTRASFWLDREYD